MNFDSLEQMLQQGNTPLAQLGLSANATEAEVKRQYKLLMLAVHPDKNPTQDTAERERLHNLTSAVNAVFAKYKKHGGNTSANSSNNNSDNNADDDESDDESSDDAAAPATNLAQLHRGNEELPGDALRRQLQAHAGLWRQDSNVRQCYANVDVLFDGCARQSFEQLTRSLNHAKIACSIRGCTTVCDDWRAALAHRQQHTRFNAVEQACQYALDDGRGQHLFSLAPHQPELLQYVCLLMAGPQSAVEYFHQCHADVLKSSEITLKACNNGKSAFKNAPKLSINAENKKKFKNASNCVSCAASFSFLGLFTMGRHHCRQCNQSVCSQCCVTINEKVVCGACIASVRSQLADQLLDHVVKMKSEDEATNVLFTSFALYFNKDKIILDDSKQKSNQISKKFIRVAEKLLSQSKPTTLITAACLLAAKTLENDTLVPRLSECLRRLWRVERDSYVLLLATSAVLSAMSSSGRCLVTQLALDATKSVMGVDRDNDHDAVANDNGKGREQLFFACVCAWATADNSKQSTKMLLAMQSAARNDDTACIAADAIASYAGLTDNKTSLSPSSRLYMALAKEQRLLAQQASPRRLNECRLEGGRALLAADRAGDALLVAMSVKRDDEALVLMAHALERLDDVTAAAGAWQRARKLSTEQKTTAARVAGMAASRVDGAAVARRLALAYAQHDVVSLVDELQLIMNGEVDWNHAYAAIASVVGNNLQNKHFWQRSGLDIAMLSLLHGCQLMISCVIDKKQAQCKIAKGVAHLHRAVQCLPMSPIDELVGAILGDVVWHRAALESLTADNALLNALLSNDDDFSLLNVNATIVDKINDVQRAFGKRVRPLRGVRRFDRAVKAQLALASDINDKMVQAEALLDATANNLNMLQLDSAPKVWVLLRTTYWLVQAGECLAECADAHTTSTRARRFAVARAAFSFASQLSQIVEHRAHWQRVGVHLASLHVMRASARQLERLTNDVDLVAGVSNDNDDNDNNHKVSSALSPFVDVDATTFAAIARRAVNAIVLVPALGDSVLSGVSQCSAAGKLLCDMIGMRVTDATLGRLALATPFHATARVFPKASTIACARYAGALYGWHDLSREPIELFETIDDVDESEQQPKRRKVSNDNDDDDNDAGDVDDPETDDRAIRSELQRQMTIDAMLADAGFARADVERNGAVSFVPRDKHGFMPKTHKPLLLGQHRGASGGLRRLDALKYDVATGSVVAIGSAANKSNTLIDAVDVGEMLAQNGVSSILFTLDPPRVDAGDDLVPFQTLRHLPGESLARTSLLETLAHTDYLLKMLTMGVEVSAKAPFRLRSASKALYKRLSFGDELEALMNEARTYNGASKRRFWIENGSVDVDIDSKDAESLLVCVASGSPMKVLTSELVLTPDGSLVDAAHADDEDDPNVKIARLLTRKYDELARAFPSFARLQELSKLLAAIHLLRASVVDQSETCYRKKQLPEPIVLLDKAVQRRTQTPCITEREKARAALADAINKYPMATRHNAEQCLSGPRPTHASVERLLRANGCPVPTRADIRAELERANASILYSPGVRSQIESAVESNYRSAQSQLNSAVRQAQAEWDRVLGEAMAQLRSADASLCETVVSLLQAQLFIDKRAATPLATAWLRNKRVPSADALKAMRARRRRVNDTLKKFGFNATLTADEVMTQFKQEHEQPRAAWGAAPDRCNWLVAAIARSDRVVYGGVQLAANIRSKGLQPPPTSARRLAPAVLNAQRSSGAANTQAQRMDNLHAANNRAFANQRAATVAAAQRRNNNNNNNNNNGGGQGGGRGSNGDSYWPTRRAAQREAKRQWGVPTSAQQHTGYRHNTSWDQSRGYNERSRYVHARDGAGRNVRIREDLHGHRYADDPSQNRGPHFHGPNGEHIHY